MKWYKFKFTDKELDNGIPVNILEQIQNAVAEARKHISNSSTPIWYRSKTEEENFNLKCVGWEIKKEIIHKYQGLPRDESDLPPLEEFY